MCQSRKGRGSAPGRFRHGVIEGHPDLPRFKLVSVAASRPKLVAIMLGAALVSGCGAQIDRHGHVFIDIDLQQVQPGMSKEDVTKVLGSPDTTSTIGGDAYYYISTTQKTVAFLKPKEIDRQVVAVYFDGGASVQQVAHYGLKDGIVVNYYKGETPSAISPIAACSKRKWTRPNCPAGKRTSARYWWASTASNNSATILVILIIGFTAGPAVSL